MEDISGLPTRRRSLKGVDFDGNTIVLAVTVARKLYRCPGCRSDIGLGSEHVLVRINEPDGDAYHQHWHRLCTAPLLREMRGVHSRPADDLSRRRAAPVRRKGKK